MVNITKRKDPWTGGYYVTIAYQVSGVFWRAITIYLTKGQYEEYKEIVQ
jgi:hypothetical protein